MAAKPLHALLDDAAARFPANPCLDFLGRRYRYRDVARLVARAARGLQAIGVFPGTRVGLMLPNTPYFVVLYFAVLKAGGVVVCFNPLLAEREIEQQIADSGVEIMATLDLGALYGKLAQGARAPPGPPSGRLPDELHPADAEAAAVPHPAAPGGGQRPDRRAPCLVRAADRQ